jgi:hypothetical protein
MTLIPTGRLFVKMFNLHSLYHLTHRTLYVNVATFTRCNLSGMIFIVAYEKYHWWHHSSSLKLCYTGYHLSGTIRILAYVFQITAWYYRNRLVASAVFFILQNTNRARQIAACKRTLRLNHNLLHAHSITLRQSANCTRQIVGCKRNFGLTFHSIPWVVNDRTCISVAW